MPHLFCFPRPVFFEISGEWGGGGAAHSRRVPVVGLVWICATPEKYSFGNAAFVLGLGGHLQTFPEVTHTGPEVTHTVRLLQGKLTSQPIQQCTGHPHTRRQQLPGARVRPQHRLPGPALVEQPEGAPLPGCPHHLPQEQERRRHTCAHATYGAELRC